MNTKRRLLIPNFNKLFFSINTAINGSFKESFLLDVVDGKLVTLFQSFLDFLENKDTSVKMLDLEVTNLQTALSIFFYFKKIPPLQFFTLERDMLLFRKLLLEHQEMKRKTEISTSSIIRSISLPSSPPLNSLKKKIVGFIHKEGETPNISVFSQFSEISKRTLKRHLSELISLGYIERESQGKKVYYKKSIRNGVDTVTS